MGHTEKRSEELVSTIDALLNDINLDVKSLERLHGRLVWYSSYVFGRELNAAVRIISRYSRSRGKTTPLKPDLSAALQFILKMNSYVLNL